MNIDNYCGSLMGLAVGDAVGTTLEFEQPGSFNPLTDMVGGGIFDLEPGQWTDDTSMALCLAESLITCKGFDPIDQLKRYSKWFEEGYLSSTGECFDIGNATHDALVRFMATNEPYCGSKNPRSAGNGSIMRLAPIPIFYADVSLSELANFAAKSSQTTHAAATCVDACEYMTHIIVGLLKGLPKDEVLSPTFHLPATSEICAIAVDSSYCGEPPEINGGGYVVSTLEAALWAFYKTNNFKDGLLKVVNLGRDADTTGAVYGQIAGAFYGLKDIPKDWVNKIAMKELILDFATKLYNQREQHGLE
ncbi:MAG: ADP-ribosylglycohydrolase family protein [bacterium]